MTPFILYQTILDADGDEVEARRWHADDLHDAVHDLTATRTAHCGGVEWQVARYHPWSSTAIITVQNAPEYRTGLREERELAIIGISRASARRLARLLNLEWQA